MLLHTLTYEASALNKITGDKKCLDVIKIAISVAAIPTKKTTTAKNSKNATKKKDALKRNSSAKKRKPSNAVR